MTDLRTAAQQALEAYSGGPNWRGLADAMDALRAALAEPVQEPIKLRPLAPLTGYYDVGGKRVWLEKDEPFPQPTPPQRPAKPQGCDHCNHPLYAAIKCRVCGRVTEPVQEPVAGVVLNEEGRAALVEHGREEWHCVVRNARRLYTAPPQRKPLAEWQINDLMADIDPEDRDSWSFRQGVYAAEKHHGVRK